ncbi:hypothetical protein AgCh_021803 [Apium graveolens]
MIPVEGMDIGLIQDVKNVLNVFSAGNRLNKESTDSSNTWHLIMEINIGPKYTIYQCIRVYSKLCSKRSGTSAKRKKASTLYKLAKPQAPPPKPTKTIASMLRKTPEEVHERHRKEKDSKQTTLKNI